MHWPLQLQQLFLLWLLKHHQAKGFVLICSSFTLLHSSASSAQQLWVQGGRGVLRPSPHTERVLRGRLLCQGQKDKIQMCCQEGKPRKSHSFILKRINTESRCAPPKVSCSPKSHRCPLISDPGESLQQWGGEHVERSQLSSRGGALWGCEGGTQHCALHGLEAW